MLMRKVIFTVVCFVAAASLNAQSLKQFTGTWRVDPDKSQEKAAPLQQNPNANAPDIPPPPPSDHKYTLEKIQEAGPLFKISGGEAGTTAVYTIDPSGKEVSDAIPDAPGCVRIATTRWDKGKLVTEWKMQRNGETFMHGTDVHSLAGDGQLLVTRSIESERHRAEVLLVLKREP
jgi:hypothetical protein